MSKNCAACGTEVEGDTVSGKAWCSIKCYHREQTELVPVEVLQEDIEELTHEWRTEDYGGQTANSQAKYHARMLEVLLEDYTMNDDTQTKDRSDLPDPDKVADELAQISRRLHKDLGDREQGYLNAADNYLRYVLGQESSPDTGTTPNTELQELADEWDEMASRWEDLGSEKALERAGGIGGCAHELRRVIENE